VTFDGRVTFELDGPDALERRLTAITGSRREATRVRHRIAEVERELEELEGETMTALARLDGEADDVRRLQTFTLRGILADLRGRKGADLEREVAELASARHAVVTLRDRQAAAVTELDGLQDRLVALGDLDVEWAEAVSAKERWVAERGDRASGRLADLAEELGDVEDEQRECEEARVAAVDALARLDEVGDALGDPAHWADGADDDRLEELCARVRAAEDAIRRLADELRDVGVEPTEETDAAVERWDRAFEPVLAGVVADGALDRRVAAAVAIVERAQVRVGRLAAEVDERSARLTARGEALLGERAELQAVPVDDA